MGAAAAPFPPLRGRRPPMRAVTTAAATAAAAAATATLLVLPPVTPAGALQVIVSAGVPPFPSPGPQYTLALPPTGGTVPPGVRPLADADEAVAVGLTTPSGQRLQCGVPVERPPGGKAVAAAARRARAASRGALFDGMETLLSAYDGLCFLRVRFWRGSGAGAGGATGIARLKVVSICMCSGWRVVRAGAIAGCAWWPPYMLRAPIAFFFFFARTSP